MIISAIKTFFFFPQIAFFRRYVISLKYASRKFRKNELVLNWTFFSNVILMQELANFFTAVVVSFPLTLLLFFFYCHELEIAPTKSRRLW